MKKTAQIEIPIQPVESPVICAPYEEPKDHWFYDKETGVAPTTGQFGPGSKHEITVRFWQEIYDDQGTLVEIHEKYPVDKGHRKL